MTYDIKITVVGETEIGKTSLSQYFITEQPQLQNATTPCASFLKKTTKVGGKTVNFQLWDTAGQERFRSIAPMYYRGSDCVLLVYDVSNEASFRQVQQFWLREVRQKCQQDAVLAVVANKQDLQRHEVPREEAQQLCTSNNLQFFETSAKTGANIVDMFLQIGRSVLDVKQQQKLQRPAQSVPIVPEIEEAPQKSGSKCCF